VSLEIDHVFVCCSFGAPEGDALVRLGLREGSPNTHPGQGTANRRFFFANTYLELLWVSDPDQVMSGAARRTRLWDRWSMRESGACPFGIVLRPGATHPAPLPFPTWSYCPAYLPEGLSIEIAEGTSLAEPELIYLPFAFRSGPPASEPIDHILPFRRVCGVTVGLPESATLSPATQMIQRGGLVAFRTEGAYTLELRFAAEREVAHDLRPALPLVLRSVSFASTDPGDRRHGRTAGSDD
jgi:hypothetical protein